MKPIRFLITMFVLLLMPTLVFAAKGGKARSKAKAKPAMVTVSGTILSAETNKPVSGAALTYLSRSEKGVETVSATAVADKDGRFSVKLATGYYSWLAKADGYGLYESGTSVKAKQTEQLTAYLRKAARLTGRLLDSNGKPVSGITIQANRWLTAVSAADGRFSINGLDARGYEPKLKQPGWVLEKSSYIHLSAGQQRELGELAIRRAASLKITVKPVSNPDKRALDRIGLNISGSSIYRSTRASAQGVASFAELPPGRYNISISDERLSGTTQEIILSEAENREVRLNAQIKPPTMQIEDYTDVFMPDRLFKIRAHGLWAEKAEAVISSVDADALAAGRIDLRKPDEIPVGLLKQIKSFPVKFKAGRDSYTRSSRFAMPGLAAGPYLLELRAKGASARFGFLVTGLGVVAKISPGGTLLFTTDLVSGQTIKGATITAYPERISVTTDTHGLARLGSTKNARKLCARNGSNLAFMELGSSGEQSGKSVVKGYLYSDRPAYRPGQTVYFKGILRQRSGEGYRLAELKTVRATVTDSGDKAICESDLQVSANGSFHGECILPANTSLGGYTINASGGAETWQGWFKVLAYRKPEFEVKQTPDRRFLVAGDTARVKLAARYYFGGSVAGAKVNWRIYTQPNWALGQGDEDSMYDDERRFGGYSDFIGEGESRLDGNGEALILVTAKTHDMPYTYTIEADVTDASSRQVSSSATISVVPSLVALNVKSGTYLTSPGKAVDVSIRAADWEGAPKALPVTLSFEQQIYEKKNRSYSWKPYATADIRTAANGSARTAYRFPQSGYWRVKAGARDSAGRKSEAASTVWVWKQGYNWEGSYRELEMEFDRKSYKPGETARLIVRSPSAGGTLLLTVEGREILKRISLPLNSMVQVVDLPVEKNYAPVIQVSAVTVAKGRFFNRTLPLRVDHQPGKLDVTIKTDKPVYAPGDTVNLTISSPNASTSATGELSLAVVDEAIFAVAPERKDDIWQYFLGNREHLVSTLHSFPRVYLGGAAKDGGAFRAKEDDLKGLKIRKVFKDTAHWQPMLTVNPDGTATASFTLPDNLTTWRATAVGHTADSRFGTGRQKFIARLELMARLAPPRFLTVGDELKIPGIVTSMTDAPQQAKGRFETVGLTLLGDTAFSGDLPPRGTLRRDITVRADKPGNATLRMLARGAASGDAMELTLPVYERGITRTAGNAMAVTGQGGNANLELPADALPGSATMQISFSPTIAANLSRAIAKLVDFPYGCVEQTLSRFIPAVHAQALLTKRSWQPDSATAAKLPLTISEGLKRLEEMQHEDGGWGWWKNDSTTLTMTAHAVYGLGLAKRAGVAVPEGMLKNGIKSLQQQINTAQTNKLAQASRALAVNGVSSKPVDARIAAAWKTLPRGEQIAFAEALGFSGQKNTLRPLLDELKREVQSEGSTAFIRDRDADSWWYGWRWGSSVIETTSGLLSLLSKEQPADPLNSRLAMFLARRQNGGWWQTTASSAAAVTALADYAAATDEASGSYEAELLLNDSKVAAYTVESGVLKSGEKSVTVPAAAVKNGVNLLRLVKSGKGAAYLTAELKYVVPPQSAQSSPALKLERTLYRIRSVKSGDKWRREYTPLKAGENVTPGEDIEVRLTVDNSKPLEYMIIEDRLPAGFESREADRDPRFMDDSGYYSWFTHRERRDEKLAFFITRLSAGRHEFRHVIFGELAGQSIALPASAWPMYQPEVRGESAPWQMQVVP
ncbi:MAG TPA: MG2 domain-containing protein [Deltaproteobacteria bacterium]|nr:MG2 domain-containing protein [Deltaproteobacteria bacterium]HQB38898.1 MG2 domain-containing protein [Deltaproteobacteria bacterium]